MSDGVTRNLRDAILLRFDLIMLNRFYKNNFRTSALFLSSNKIQICDIYNLGLQDRAKIYCRTATVVSTTDLLFYGFSEKNCGVAKPPRLQLNG